MNDPLNKLMETRMVCDPIIRENLLVGQASPATMTTFVFRIVYCQI